jgi:hypothetical protein
MRIKLKNIIYFKFELNDEIENTSFFFTKEQRKLEIKRIRTQLKKITYDKLGLKDEIENK